MLACAASIAGELTGPETRMGNPKCSNDVSPCHRAIAGKHFLNGSTKPLKYDASLSALVGRRILLGSSMDIQLIMLLGGDSSLDLEKVVFKALGPHEFRACGIPRPHGIARTHFTES